MQQLVSILLSVILLAQGISFNSGELEKMDTLLEHAKFHKEKYGDNFAVFMDKHYGNQKNKHLSEHQEEQKEHQDLPFHQSAQLLIQTAILSEAVKSNISSTVIITPRHENYFYEQLHASIVVDEILQPPKSS
jgi:hypothetical protein